MSLGFGFGLQYSKLSGGGFEGMLNLFPNPKVGFELRRINKNYEGFCIKVRRSSDGLDRNIGYVNNVLDTASLLDFAGSGDAFLTIWYDQSGLNNNAFQTSAANQPKIVDSGSVILENGKPAILFSGNQWLQTVNTYPTSQYLSAFYLASSTGDNQRVIDTRGTGAFGRFKGWHAKFSNSLTGDNAVIDDSEDKSISTESIIRSGQKLVSILANGGSVGVNSFIKDFTNSVLSQQVNSSEIIDYDSNNVLTIGTNSNGQNTQKFSGKLQAIILYSLDKDSERVGIENNINTYYNIY